MKRIYLFLLAVVMMPMMAQAKMSFTIEGPEEVYNRIRVLNETSLETLRCRLVVLAEDGSTERVYGIYNLGGANDKDSNTDRIDRGKRIGIELPKDLPVELSFSVEYKDYPLFDVILIHLYDKSSEFNED